MAQSSSAKIDKMKRLAQQLSVTEQLLKTHPLTSEKLSIIQTVLHGLQLQLQWASQPSISRLLITFETALKGKEKTKSQTGFLGPHLAIIFKVAAELMKAVVKVEQRSNVHLMSTFNQIVFLGTCYTSSQLLDNWKELFPMHDPDAAYKAGLLLKELGLTFVLGTKTIQSAYFAVTQGLNFSEVSSKHITNIGTCLILGLLIVMENEAKRPNEDFIETIKNFINPALYSLEFAIQELQFQGIIDSRYMAILLALFQTFKQTSENNDLETLQLAIKESCETLGFSYEGLIKDLEYLKEVCSQLNQTFRNIFYQLQQRTTTMTQSA